MKQRNNAAAKTRTNPWVTHPGNWMGALMGVLLLSVMLFFGCDTPDSEKGFDIGQALSSPPQRTALNGRTGKKPLPFPKTLAPTTPFRPSGGITPATLPMPPEMPLGIS